MKLMPNEDTYVEDVVFDLEIHHHIYWIFSREEYNMGNVMSSVEDMAEKIRSELRKRHPSIYWETMIEETSNEWIFRVCENGYYPIHTNQQATYLLHKF